MGPQPTTLGVKSECLRARGQLQRQQKGHEHAPVSMRTDVGRMVTGAYEKLGEEAKFLRSGSRSGPVVVMRSTTTMRLEADHGPDGSCWAGAQVVVVASA